MPFPNAARRALSGARRAGSFWGQPVFFVLEFHVPRVVVGQRIPLPVRTGRSSWSVAHRRIPKALIARGRWGGRRRTFHVGAGNKVAEAGGGPRHGGATGPAVADVSHARVYKVAGSGLCFGAAQRARLLQRVARLTREKCGIVGVDRHPLRVGCVLACAQVARRRVMVARAARRRRVGHDDRLCVAPRRRRVVAN